MLTKFRTNREQRKDKQPTKMKFHSTAITSLVILAAAFPTATMARLGGGGGGSVVADVDNNNNVVVVVAASGQEEHRELTTGTGSSTLLPKNCITTEAQLRTIISQSTNPTGGTASSASHPLYEICTDNIDITGSTPIDLSHKKFILGCNKNYLASSSGGSSNNNQCKITIKTQFNEAFMSTNDYHIDDPIEGSQLNNGFDIIFRDIEFTHDDSSPTTSSLPSGAAFNLETDRHIGNIGNKYNNQITFDRCYFHDMKHHDEAAAIIANGTMKININNSKFERIQSFAAVSRYKISWHHIITDRILSSRKN